MGSKLIRPRRIRLWIIILQLGFGVEGFWITDQGQVVGRIVTDYDCDHSCQFHVLSSNSNEIGTVCVTTGQLLTLSWKTSSKPALAMKNFLNSSTKGKKYLWLHGMTDCLL